MCDSCGCKTEGKEENMCCGGDEKGHSHEHEGCGCGHTHEPLSEKDQIKMLEEYHKALLGEAKAIEKKLAELKKATAKKPAKKK